jgi:hypothetical protein
MKEGEPKSKPEVLWSLTQGPPQPNRFLYKERKNNISKLNRSHHQLCKLAVWQRGVSMESIIIEQERGIYGVVFLFVLLSFQVYEG